MVELTPSNDAVKSRLEELRGRLRRVLALAAATQEAAWLLPAGYAETETVQELAGLLNESAPAAMGDLLWLIHSLEARAPQIESILKSVA